MAKEGLTLLLPQYPLSPLHHQLLALIMLLLTTMTVMLMLLLALLQAVGLINSGVRRR
jgi:hypothetical protein